MAWIGYQPGMSAVNIQLAKGKLAKKFSYGHGLDYTTGLYTPDLQPALSTFQVRTGKGLRTDGVLDFATQKELGTVNAAGQLIFVNADGTDAPGDPRPVIFTAQGTGVDMWTGYPADTARAVQDLAYFQPTAYPAAPFPMWPSVIAGIDEMVTNISKFMLDNPKRDIWLAGYSQGGIIVSMLWLVEFAPGGRLSAWRNNVKKVVTWGNPCRELGKALGNVRAGWPVPEGQGILAKHRLVNTPDFWADFAHGANSPWGRDLYTDTPNDQTGVNESAICDIVMQETLWSGPAALLKAVISLLGHPFTEADDMIKAVLQAGMFFGGGTGPHVNYDIQPAIDFLRSA